MCRSLLGAAPKATFIKRLASKNCTAYSHSVRPVSHLWNSTEWQDRLLDATAGFLAPDTGEFPQPSEEMISRVLEYAFGISNDTSFEDLIHEIEEIIPQSSVTVSVVFGMLSCVSAIAVFAYIIYISKKMKILQKSRTISYLSSEQSVDIPSLPRDFSLQIFCLKIAIVVISIVTLTFVIASIVYVSAFFHTHNKITAELSTNINFQVKRIYYEMEEFLCAIRDSVENPKANMITALNGGIIKQLHEVNTTVLSNTHHEKLANNLIDHFESTDTESIIHFIQKLETNKQLQKRTVYRDAVNEVKTFYDKYRKYFHLAQLDTKSPYNVHNILDYNAHSYTKQVLKTKFDRPKDMLSKEIYNELYNIDREVLQFKGRNLEAHYTITNNTAMEMIVAIMVLQLAAFLLIFILYFAPLSSKVIIICSIVVFALMFIPTVYEPSVKTFADVRQFGCNHFDQNKQNIWNIVGGFNESFLQRNVLNLKDCHKHDGYVFFGPYTDRALQGIRDELSTTIQIIESISMKHASGILSKLMDMKALYIEFDQKVNDTIKRCSPVMTRSGMREESIKCFESDDKVKIMEELIDVNDVISKFKGFWNCDDGSTCKNLSSFDDLENNLKSTISDPGINSMLTPINSSTTSIKTSLMRALPKDCQMTTIYTNILARICNQVKPFYLVVQTLYIYNGSLWLIGVVYVLISILRNVQPVRFRSDSKRKLNAENQKRFGNSVGVSLDCIAIDPRKAYKEFLKPIVIAESTEKTSASKVSTSKMGQVNESKEPVADPTVVDLGWPGDHNYFNGNWVVPMGQAHRYIMTAAPTADTAIDFWHVVFRYNCKAIVMLCDFVEKENGKSVEKSFEYWNEKTHRVFKNKYAKYKIKCTAVKKSVIKNVKHLVFSVSNGYVTKKVELIQYTGWQDCLAPENPEEMAEVMKTIYEKIGHTDEPVVVQCADGLGRSAAFVGIDVLMGIVDSDPNPASSDLIKMMRQFRSNSYTNKWQYYFTYICFFQFHVLNLTYGEVSKIYNYIKDRKASFVEKMKAASTAEDYIALKERRVKTAKSYIEFQNTNDKKGKKKKESSSEKERNLSGTYLKGCIDGYLLGKRLGAGTYGEVYQATKEKQDSKMITTSKDNEVEVKYAVKTEKGGITCSSLISEIYVLMDVSTNVLENRNQIVQYVDKGRTASFDFLVMSLVGKSLSTIQQHAPKKLNSFSAMYISIQSFNAIHQLHRCGFIHRDIKPGNFAIGEKKNEKVVFILDFGLAKRSLDTQGKLAYRRGKETGFVGTMRYAPRAAHEMKKQNSCDDIESWLYMSIEMFQKLPWKGNVNSDQVLESKCNLMDGKYWRSMRNNGLPIAFLHLIRMIAVLNPAEAPDYRKLMHVMMGAECDCDLDLFWIRSAEIHDKAQYESLATRATSRDKKAILASFTSLGRF